jgi:hypothetical protein
LAGGIRPRLYAGEDQACEGGDHGFGGLLTAHRQPIFGETEGHRFAAAAGERHRAFGRIRQGIPWISGNDFFDCPIDDHGVPARYRRDRLPVFKKKAKNYFRPRKKASLIDKQENYELLFYPQAMALLV